MAIPLSALRRALIDAARNPKVERTLAAPLVGAGAGGAFGAAGSALDGDYSDAGDYAMTGAGIGAGLGALGAGAMFRQTLREALAEQAASRGMGRRAVREVADGEDAARFTEASLGPSIAQVAMDKLRATARTGAPLDVSPEEIDLFRQMLDREGINAANMDDDLVIRLLLRRAE